MIFERNSTLHTRAAGLTAALFIFSTLSAPLVEANFWSERRDSARGRGEVLLAKAPIGAGTPAELLSQMPSTVKPLSLAPAAPADVLGRLAETPNETVAALIRALPAQSGSVRQVLLPARKTEKTIVHIQDVHLNDEAQRHIAAAVESLVAEKKVGLVALEGAFHDLELSQVRAFPYKEITEGVADYMRREGKISGAVYAGLTGPALVPFTGVDEKTRYDANVDAYRRSRGQMASTASRLAKEARALDARKPSVFNPALLGFDKQVQDYHAEKLPLTRFAQLLAATVDVGPQTQLLVKAAAMEAALDFQQVEADRRHLVEALARRLEKPEMSRLMEWGVAYRLGQLSHGRFYGALETLCREKGLSLAKFPAMDGYIRYVLASDRINAGGLFSELIAAEDRGYAVLARSDDEKALVAQSRIAGLSRKLADFALTPEEWKQYQSMTEARRDPSLESFEAFYREAEARNDAIVAKLIAAMERHNAKTAVLVTGGFHAPGVDERLHKAGVASVTYVPKITKIDLSNASAYLNVFAQEKTPLEQLFEGRKLFTAPEVFTPANRQVIRAGQAAGAAALGRPGQANTTVEKPGTARRAWSTFGQAFFTRVTARLDGARVVVEKIETWRQAESWKERLPWYAIVGSLTFAAVASAVFLFSAFGDPVSVFAMASLGVVAVSRASDVQIRPDVLEKHGRLFGDLTRFKTAVAEMTDLVSRLRAEALAARTAFRGLIARGLAAYGFPAAGQTNVDADDKPATFKDIVDGAIANFLGIAHPHAWRLNDPGEGAAPLSVKLNPTKNPGAELTGPTDDLGMLMGALNAQTASYMPDWEDAGNDYLTKLFQAMENLTDVLNGKHYSADTVARYLELVNDLADVQRRLARDPGNDQLAIQQAEAELAIEEFERAQLALGDPAVYAHPGKVDAEGRARLYMIRRLREDWATVFFRVPGLHLDSRHVTLNGKPVPAMVVGALLFAMNNLGMLQAEGKNLAIYVPKIESQPEARIPATLLTYLENMMQVQRGTIKAKMLNERVRFSMNLLPIMWTMRHWLVGTNVGRWDYINSFIEMFKDNVTAVLSDPHRVGMNNPFMRAYVRFNALMNLLVSVNPAANGAPKEKRLLNGKEYFYGELTNGAPIGGMTAVMKKPNAPTGVNESAVRSAFIDKLRERVTGIFVIHTTNADGETVSTVWDTYRQSWVATPDRDYVQAAERALKADFNDLPALIAELTDAERADFVNEGLLELVDGQVSIRLERGVNEYRAEDLTYEKLFSDQAFQKLFPKPENPVITRVGIINAVYQATEYAFQILHGNFAAAIDDQKILGQLVNKGRRLMNDLATFEIFQHWLWTVRRLAAFLKGQAYADRMTDRFMAARWNSVVKYFESRLGLTPVDGMPIGGAPWTTQDWTGTRWGAVMAARDARLAAGTLGQFDPAKATLAMDVVRRLVRHERWVPYGSRVLISLIDVEERAKREGRGVKAAQDEVLRVVFELEPGEVDALRESSSEESRRLAAVHDYVYDHYPQPKVPAPSPRQDAAGRSLRGIVADRLRAAFPNLFPEGPGFAPAAPQGRRVVEVIGQGIAPEAKGTANTAQEHLAKLIAAGAHGVLIGHSETRAGSVTGLGFTNAQVRDLVHRAWAAPEMETVLFAMGEPDAVYSEGIEATKAYLKEQIRSALEGLDLSAPGAAERLVLAYEPIWAIGTGKTPKAPQVQDIHAFIRGEIAAIATPEIAARVRIIYGGSVKAANAAEFMALEDVDGALVGGASLAAKDFLPIVEAAKAAVKAGGRVPYVGANHKDQMAADPAGPMLEALFDANARRTVQVAVAPGGISLQNYIDGAAAFESVSAAAGPRPSAAQIQERLQPLAIAALDSITGLDQKAFAQGVLLNAALGRKVPTGQELRDNLVRLGAAPQAAGELAAYVAAVLATAAHHEAFKAGLFDTLVAINNAELGAPLVRAVKAPPGSVLSLFRALADNPAESRTLAEIGRELGVSEHTLVKDERDLRLRLSPEGIPLVVSHKDGGEARYRINPALSASIPAIHAVLEAHVRGANGNQANDLDAAAKGIRDVLAEKGAAAQAPPAAQAMDRQVRDFSELHKNDVPIAGGKSANLGFLMNHGLPVPDGYSTLSAFYQDLLATKPGVHQEISKILGETDTANPEQLASAERRLKEIIKALVIPAEMMAKVEKSFDALAARLGVPAEKLRVAVRSSATAEDRELTPEMRRALGKELSSGSSAGQQSTLLHISRDGLADAIKEDLESLFNLQAISYRDNQGLRDFLISLSKAERVAFRRAALNFTSPDKALQEAVREVGRKLVYKKVVSREQLAAAVKAVAPQLAARAAAAYHPYINAEELSLPLAVQEMVKSVVSFTMFSYDESPEWTAYSFQKDKSDASPAEGRVFVMEILYGLGEAVVQGLAGPDRYYVHIFEQDGEQKVRIIEKIFGEKFVQVIDIELLLNGVGLTAEEFNVVGAALRAGAPTPEFSALAASKLAAAGTDPAAALAALQEAVAARPTDRTNANLADPDSPAQGLRISRLQLRHLADALRERQHNPKTNTITTLVPPAKQRVFALSDEKVMEIALMGKRATDIYGNVRDMEGAIDPSGRVRLVQSRAITVPTEVDRVGYHQDRKSIFLEGDIARMEKESRELVTGFDSQNVGVGELFFMDRTIDRDELHRQIRAKAAALKKAGRKLILVAESTKPDDEPILKLEEVAGIIAFTGGKTSHAAIIARELGVPSVVGINSFLNALGIRDHERREWVEKLLSTSHHTALDSGATVALDGNAGKVYFLKAPAGFPPAPADATGRVLADTDYAPVIEKRNVTTDMRHLPKLHFTKPGFIVASANVMRQNSMVATDNSWGGVKLKRAEFDLSSIGHPMAFVHFDAWVKNEAYKAGRGPQPTAEELAGVERVAGMSEEARAQFLAETAARITGYPSGQEYFISKYYGALASMSAAGSIDAEVLVRHNDFKQKELADIPLGRFYAVKEKVYMEGYRGAAWLLAPANRPALIMELKAMARAFEDGYRNLGAFIPFVRSPEELEQYLALAEEHLPPAMARGMMVETVANVMFAKEFVDVLSRHALKTGAPVFGSVGTNDLTQLTRRSGREEPLMKELYREDHETVLGSIEDFSGEIQLALKRHGAEFRNRHGRDMEFKLSLCGEGPTNLADANPAAAIRMIRPLTGTGVSPQKYFKLRRLIAADELQNAEIASTRGLKKVNGVDAASPNSQGAGARHLIAVRTFADLLTAYPGAFLAFAPGFEVNVDDLAELDQMEAEDVLQHLDLALRDSTDAGLKKEASRLRASLPLDDVLALEDMITTPRFRHDLAKFLVHAALDQAGILMRGTPNGARNFRLIIHSERLGETEVFEPYKGRDVPIPLVTVRRGLDRVLDLDGRIVTVDFASGAMWEGEGELKEKAAAPHRSMLKRVAKPREPRQVVGRFVAAGDIQKTLPEHPLLLAGQATTGRAAVRRAVVERLREAAKGLGAGSVLVYQTSDLNSQDLRDLPGFPSDVQAEDNPPLGLGGFTRIFKDDNSPEKRLLKWEMEGLAEVLGELREKGIQVVVEVTDVRELPHMTPFMALLQEVGIDPRQDVKLSLRVETPDNIYSIEQYLDSFPFAFVHFEEKRLKHGVFNADQDNPHLEKNPEREARYLQHIYNAVRDAAAARGALELLAAPKSRGVAAGIPDEWNAWAESMAQKFVAAWHAGTPPRGENGLRLRRRAQEVFNEMRALVAPASGPAQDGMLISHGYVLTEILAAATGRRPETEFENIIPTAVPVVLHYKDGKLAAIRVLVRAAPALEGDEVTDLAALKKYLQGVDAGIDVKILEGIAASARREESLAAKGTLVLMRQGRALPTSMTASGSPRLGSQTDVGLTRGGERAALAIGRLFASHFGPQFQFDEVRTSTIRRTLETREKLVEGMGRDGVISNTDRRLNERNFGLISGFTPQELPEAVKEVLLKIAQNDDSVVSLTDIGELAERLEVEWGKLDMVGAGPARHYPLNVAPLMTPGVERTLVRLAERAQQSFPRLGFPTRTVALLAAVAELMYLPVSLLSPRVFATRFHQNQNAEEASGRYMNAVLLASITMVASLVALLMGGLAIGTEDSAAALAGITTVVGLVANIVAHAVIDHREMREVKAAAAREAAAVVALLDKSGPAALDGLIPESLPVDLNSLAGPRFSGPLRAALFREALLKALDERKPDSLSLRNALVQSASLAHPAAVDNRPAIFVALIKTPQDVEALAVKIRAEPTPALVLPVLIGLEGREAWFATRAQVERAARGRHKVEKARAITVQTELNAADLGDLLKNWSLESKEAGAALRDRRLLLAVSRHLQWAAGSFADLPLNDPLRQAEVFILGLLMPAPVKLMRLFELDVIARQVVARMA